MALTLKIHWKNRSLFLQESIEDKPSPPKLPRLGFELNIGNLTIRGEKMRYTLMEGTTGSIRFFGIDEHGHETGDIEMSNIEGLSLTSSDTNVFTVDNDGRFHALAPNPDQTMPIMVNGSIDTVVGEGENILLGSFEVIVSPAGAVRLGMEPIFDTPAG